MPMHLSTPLPNIELINLKETEISPLISKCQIKVCYVGDEPNRNGTIFTKEVAKTMAPSLRGAMIVGYYNENTEDFEGHNEVIEFRGNEVTFAPTTKPYGFVDLGAKVWFQKFLDDGNIEHEYLMTEGYLWTGQFPECVRILEKGNNQSMELDEKNFDGSWTKTDNSNLEFFIVNEAIISKLCILGEDVEPCFEGAQITKTQFSFDNSFKEQMYSMMNEVRDLLEKGGKTMALEEKELCPECGKPLDECECKKHSAKEEKDEKEICPDCGKPIDECECKKEKDEKGQYNLDEIPEYTELKNNYSTLETQFNTLKEEVEGLREFKLNAEREQKKDLIDSFYMLSDEDKEDVTTNIDKYSLDEIESKLSVICFRNKVSFDTKEEKEPPQTTYSLTHNEDDDDVPAWVKAMREVANKNN